MPVTDRVTLRGLTQFISILRVRRRQTAEYKRDRTQRTHVTGVCDNQCATTRKLLILKLRDAGAVDQARLESTARDVHQIAATHLKAHSSKNLRD
jgi:hypothetical protein